jgi:hypothetical protein
VSFKVDEDTFKVYAQEIIPFWKGKTQRDKGYSLHSHKSGAMHTKQGYSLNFKSSEHPAIPWVAQKLFSSGG